MKKSILLSLVLLVSTSYTTFNVPASVLNVRNYVAGLVTQAGTQVQSTAVTLGNKVADVTPDAVKNVLKKGYDSSVAFYNNNPTAVKAAVAVATVTAAAYVIYKRYCPVAHRAACCKSRKK